MIADYKNGKIVYRDETKEEIAEREAWERAHPEEIAEMEAQQAEMSEPEPTPEERLAIMEDAFAELCMEVFGNG